MRNGATDLARVLRRRETDAERALWAKLRNRQSNGWKFKRQVPFANYVLDFYCFEARLVIEVDGGSHAEDTNVASDRARTNFLEANGLRIMRFWNGDVLNNIDGVLDMIDVVLGQQPAPSTGASHRPLPRGEAK